MKFTKAIEVDDFMRTVASCEGDVWLESPMGDKYVLKSVFSQYTAMSTLLTEKGDELELYCQLPADSQKFYKYFSEYPEVV